MTEQQDTSEAFAFLTETLQLPLLPLQVDLFHHGKRDEGDSKVVHERLLNLAVPEDTEGKGIKLEDCLEEYFNTRVDVLRDSEVAKKSLTGDTLTPLTPVTPTTFRNTIRMVGPDASEGSVMMSASPIVMTPVALPDTPTHPSTLFKPDYCSDEQSAGGQQAAERSSGEPVEEKPAEEKLAEEEPAEEKPAEEEKAEEKPAEEKAAEEKAAEEKPAGEQASSKEAVPELKLKSPLTREHLLKERALSQPLTRVISADMEGRPSTRHRSASVIQRVVIDDQGRPTGASTSANPDGTTMMQRAKRAGSTVVKAVTIPAWQFFRLIRKYHAFRLISHFC